MQNNRKTDIKVGITVLVGLILLLWIFGWAKNFSLNSNNKILTIEFNSVAGLEKGDAVTINGVRKGYVTDIKVNGNKVDVKTNLDSDVKLKSDAKFSIVMLDLMGGKKIDINPGSSPENLDFNKIQHGIFAGDISTAMVALSSVQEDLISVIKEIKVTLTSMNKFMGNDDFINDLSSSIHNLSIMTSKLNSVISENKSELNMLIKNGSELSKNLNSTLTENNENIKSTFELTQKTLSETKNVMNKFNGLLDETKRKKNNLGKLLYDDKIINDLKSSLEKLNKLSEILIKQLKNEGVNVDAHIF